MSLIAATSNPLIEQALIDKLDRRSPIQGTLGELEPVAIRLGLLRDADVIVPNSQEVLYVALARARALAAAWQPPLPARRIQVAGRGGVATLQSSLLNLREGGMISAHDYRVGTALARALCGGDVESGTRVDEQWLLDVECHEFIELLRTPTTQQRIQHTLETGSLLRN